MPLLLGMEEIGETEIAKVVVYTNTSTGYVVYISTKHVPVEVDDSEVVRLSQILETVFSAYKDNNIKYSCVYDLCGSWVPSKKLIDFWVKFFRGQERNMLGHQNASAVLIQSKELTDILNVLLSMWATTGEFKLFNGDAKQAWEWVSRMNTTVSVPKTIRKKLNRSAF